MADDELPPPQIPSIRSIRAARRARGVNVPVDPTQPQVPPQQEPEVDEARMEFELAATDKGELSQGRRDASREAFQQAEGIANIPPPIPRNPTVGESVARGLLPQRARDDLRPASVSERLGELVGKAPRVALDVASAPTDLAKFAVGLGLDAAGVPDESRPSVLKPASDFLLGEEEKGYELENGALWLVRVLGTAAPALVQQTVGRLPQMDFGKLAAAAQTLPSDPKAAAQLAADGVQMSSSVSKELTGTDVRELQKIRRVNPVADWLQGVVEQIERGGGLEELYGAPNSVLGPKVGWWVGLGIDTLTDWEGALLAGPSLARTVARRADAIKELVPKGVDLSTTSRWWRAMNEPVTDTAEWLAPKITAELEAGRMTIDDLPFRARAEAVALGEDSLTLDELSRIEGVGVSQRQAATNPEFEAARAELQAAYEEQAAARKGAATAKVGEGVPGQDPGAFAERVVAEKKGPRDPSQDRPPPPEFGHRITSADQYYREVQKLYDRGLDIPEKGYDLKRGDGVRRMEGFQDIDPASDNYTLYNAAGDVIGQGSLEQMVERMSKRLLDFDEVWAEGARRPVARWSRKLDDRGQVKLAPDYHFATREEEELVRAGTAKLLAEKGAELRPGGRDRTKRAIGQALADTATRAPASQTTATSSSRLSAVVTDAIRLEARDRLGTWELAVLPNGALVPRTDRDRILRDTAKSMPLTRDRAIEVISGKKPMTPEEAQSVSSAMTKYGIVHEPGQLTVDQWYQMRQGAMRDIGGVLADTRYRIGGTPSFVDKLFRSVSDLHLDRTTKGWLGKAAARFPLSNLTGALLDDKLGKLPTHVRTTLRRLRTELERVTDDVLDEFRSAARGKQRHPKLMAQVLNDLVGRYQVVHPEELAAARRVLEGGSLDIDWRGPRPRWLDSSDELVNRSGMARWARGVQAEAAAQAQRWVEAVVATTGKSVRGTTTAEAIRARPLDEMLDVHHELYSNGITDGEALRRVLERIGLGDAKFDPTRAMAALIVHERQQSILKRAMRDLIDEGIVVRGADVRAKAGTTSATGVGRSVLDAMAEGTHRSWNPEFSRWEYHYTPAQVAWADARLYDWGIDVGSGAELSKRKVAGFDVVVPTYLADEIDRLVRLGLWDDTRALTGRRAIDELMRNFKAWTTYGVLLPKPSYYLGQMLGMAPTLWTTIGPAATASTATTLIKHPLMAGQLMMRMANAHPVFRSLLPEANLFRTDAGDIFDADTLERIARKHGLQDTHASFETGQQFASVIARELTPAYSPRRLVKPLVWWQEMLETFAGAADGSARIGVFLDNVKRGVPPDQAAQIARGAALDFRDMTEWERRYMRLAFTFYAFMRKNSDAYLKAMFHNPGRVASQMRLAHASLEGSKLDDVELGAIKPQDLARLTVYESDGVVNDKGRVHSLYRLNRWQSPPMGVMEFLSTMNAMATPFTGGDTKPFLENINPLIGSIVLMAMQRRIDREIDDSATANRIPPVLMMGPMAPLMRELFDVGPMPLGQYDDDLEEDLDATAELGGRWPAVWAAGMGDPAHPERGRRRWQMFATWLGAPVFNAQALAETSLLAPLGMNLKTSPTMTQSDATLAWLTGLRIRPAIDHEEAIRRYQRGIEREFRSATKEARLPERAPR